jgi:hypothetical protein
LGGTPGIRKTPRAERPQEKVSASEKVFFDQCAQNRVPDTLSAGDRVQLNALTRGECFGREVAEIDSVSEREELWRCWSGKDATMRAKVS